MFVRSGLVEANAIYDERDVEFREYCLLPVLGPYQLKRPLDKLIPLPTTRRLQLDDAAAQAVVRDGGAWLIVRGRSSTAGAVTRELLAEFRQIGTPLRVVEKRAFGGVLYTGISVDIPAITIIIWKIF